MSAPCSGLGHLEACVRQLQLAEQTPTLICVLAESNDSANVHRPEQRYDDDKQELQFGDDVRRILKGKEARSAHTSLA
jgi:hypothetical protein